MNKLRQLLINAGTNGVTQNDIIRYLRPHLHSPIIKTQLEWWREHNAVQRFLDYKGVSRPTTIWRATTIIMEENMDTKLIDFVGLVEHQTDNAVLFLIDGHGEPIWWPLSQVEIEIGDETDILTVPDWLVKKKSEELNEDLLA